MTTKVEPTETVSDCCEKCFKWGKKYGEYAHPCNNPKCECHNSPTDTTVSVCKHCHMDLSLRNPSGYCDHLEYPTYCDHCNITADIFSTPTHSPNYKVKMHKDYNIGVVTPDDSPTSPTVEKWEQSTGLKWLNDCSSDPVEHYPTCQGCERIVVLNQEGYEKLVQEAKAERDNWWKRELGSIIKTAYSECESSGDYHPGTVRLIENWINRFSLKQEESLEVNKGEK